MITAFSNIVTEPVPVMFRPEKEIALKKAALEKRIMWAAPEVREMLIRENGATMGPRGEILFPLPSKETCDTLKQQFLDTSSDDKSFINVCWDTNKVYRNTALTETHSDLLKHTDYIAFINKLATIDMNIVSLIPLFIKSVVSSDDCLKCLQGLSSVSEHFKDELFFNSLYKMIALGAECGTFKIE
jgi:hypothetical protein